MAAITSTLYVDLTVGLRASATRTLAATDIETLAIATGDVDATQLAGADAHALAANATLHAPGSAAIALISALLLRHLPGPGARIVATDCRYAGELRVGDSLTASVELVALAPPDCADFDCRCVNQDGDTLVAGRVRVAAPTTVMAFDDIATPALLARRRDGFAHLAARAALLPPVACAVVHPCDRDSLLGALAAAQRGLIVPILVGPEARIRATASECGVSLDGLRIVAVAHSHAAAAAAVALARDGEVQALMKGSLHTDELMEAVVNGATGLRTDRRMSHVFVMDVPTYPRLLLVTDAAVNIAPDLETKADIVRNAIVLAHVLGIAVPKIAIMSAVETINPKIESTVHAAALCKMAERGQIIGGMLDGPLAFDNAVSAEAARTKGIVSAVAGCADVLVVPDIESGNMVAKQLQYLAGAGSAGIVMGARVPIVLTSRADSVRSRLASTVVMKLVAHALRDTRTD